MYLPALKSNVRHFLCLSILVLGLCPLTFAESATHKVRTIKAAYILNFINFSSWPEGAFVSKNEPVVVSYFGNPDFARSIAYVLSTRKAHNRAIEFQHLQGFSNQEKFNAADADDIERIRRSLKNSHVVIFGQSEREVAQLILNKNIAPNVLSVGDDRWFAESGAMLALDQRDNRVGFYANVEAINASSVQVSSRALRLAKLVRSD